MASGRIKGITIEIDGNTTPLQRALSNVDKSLRTTEQNLKDVNKLLKLDPGNVDLLKQKQEYLARAIENVKEKLRIEKEAYEQLKDADPSAENAEKQKALEREIIDTEQALKKYNSELDDTEKELKGVKTETDKATTATDKLEKETDDAEDTQRRSNQGWTAARQVLADLATRGIEIAIQAVKRLGEAMVRGVQDAGDYADEILTLSHQTGLATDTLQELRYMEELLDVSTDTISGSLRRLTNNMQSASNGTGQAYDAFEALGVSVVDTDGHLRRAEDVFYDTIDALRGMNNETERDAYSMDIFGRSAQELNPLIEAGSDAMEAFAAEAHEMGYVLDNDALTSLGEMDDSFERVKNQMEAVRNQIVVQMAPAIEEIAEAFIAWAQEVDWSEVAAKIGQVLDAVTAVVSFVTEHKEIVLAALGGLAAAIAAATTAQWGLNAAMSANPIGAIITAVVALTALLGLFEERTGHVSWSWGVAFEGMLRVLKNWKDFITRAIEQIIKTFDRMVSFFRSVWERIKGIFGMSRNFFDEQFNGAYSDITGQWGGLPSFFGGVVGDTESSLSGVESSISNPFQSAYEDVTSTWSGISGFFSRLNIQLPHIKLPHFNLTGQFSLSPPSVPRMSIDWYDKGGIFTQPTVIGVGERRPEFVGALDDLRKIVAESSGGTTVNVTVNGAPGQDENAIANLVMQKMQQAVNRRGAVYA